MPLQEDLQRQLDVAKLAMDALVENAVRLVQIRVGVDEPYGLRCEVLNGLSGEAVVRVAKNRELDR